MIKRCIAYGAAMLVILYTFLIYDAEVLSAILILSILYPILSLSWLTLTRKSLRTKRDRVPEMGEEGKEIRAGILLKNLSRYFAIQYEDCGDRQEQRRKGGKNLQGKPRTGKQ